MLTPSEQQIVRDAAHAQRAFWRLLSCVSDDPRHKLELLDYRVRVDAELRGDRPPAPAADHSTPIDEAVRLELEALAPAVRTRLVLRRAAHKLAVSCAPARLTLSYTAAARQQLRAVVTESATTSALTQHELSRAIGVSETTLYRHLRGETMSRERRDWYHRLERIVREGSLIHVIVRAIAPTEKRLTAGAR